MTERSLPEIVADASRAVDAMHTTRLTTQLAIERSRRSTAQMLTLAASIKKATRRSSEVRRRSQRKGGPQQKA